MVSGEQRHVGLSQVPRPCDVEHAARLALRPVFRHLDAGWQVTGCTVAGCFHVHESSGLCAKHAARRRARAVVHADICACLGCVRKAHSFREMAAREELAGREGLR